jgi:hypothetical protein
MTGSESKRRASVRKGHKAHTWAGRAATLMTCSGFLHPGWLIEAEAAKARQ